MVGRSILVVDLVRFRVVYAGGIPIARDNGGWSKKRR